jgi:hypothetical protein
LSVQVHSGATAADERAERRWVLIEEAAAESGVPVTSIKSWAKSNLLDARVERVQRRSRMLVDLDEVLLARAIAAESETVTPESTEERWLGLTLKLSSLLVSAQSRALEAETALQRERRRVREMETWLGDKARFDEVEHLQLGRLLALASSRREGKRIPLVSSARALSLLVYVVATFVFAFLLLSGRG